MGCREQSWEAGFGGVATDEFFHSKNATFENKSESSCFNQRIETSNHRQWI